MTFGAPQFLWLLTLLPALLALFFWNEKRRTALAIKYAPIRAKMKKEGDYVGLSLLPRDASPLRQSERSFEPA